MKQAISLHGRILLLVSALLPLPGLAACLEMADLSYSQHTTEFGTPEVTWEGQLRNGCNQPFDADMTVRFVDDNGDDVYTVSERATAGIKSRMDVGKRVSVPIDVADAMAGIEVDIVERERPF